MQTFESRYSPKIPPSVYSLEHSLINVLKEHYYVQNQRFFEISSHEMLKHELCHLTKALNKVHLACEEPSKRTIKILEVEVISDLIIYALECAIGYDLDWWSYFTRGEKLPENNILSYLSKKFIYKSQNENELHCFVRNTLIRSISCLGDFCDKTDHNQISNIDLKIDVIIPLMESSFYLSTYHHLDLDSLFSCRLIDVENKYVGQPNYKSRK